MALLRHSTALAIILTLVLPAISLYMVNRYFLWSRADVMIRATCRGCPRLCASTGRSGISGRRSAGAQAENKKQGCCADRKPDLRILCGSV